MMVLITAFANPQHMQNMNPSTLKKYVPVKSHSRKVSEDWQILDKRINASLIAASLVPHTHRTKVEDPGCIDTMTEGGKS